MGFVREFRDSAIQGNAVDLAVALVPPAPPEVVVLPREIRDSLGAGH